MSMTSERARFEIKNTSVAGDFETVYNRGLDITIFFEHKARTLELIGFLHGEYTTLEEIAREVNDLRNGVYGNPCVADYGELE